MSVKQLSSTFDVELYNSKAAHPMQSWQWGEAKAKTGVELLRIGEFDGKELINVFQMTFHRIPKTKFKVGYIPRSLFPSDDVCNYLKEYGKKHNVTHYLFEPQVKTTEWNNKLNESMRLSPAPLFARWTQMLDLTLSEEELLKSFHSKTRYNIRLAEKKGVTIKEESNDEGFDKFLTLYFETCKRQHYYGHNETYHSTIWNTMKGKMSHILIAYYEGIPLAAYELFYFNNVLYYTYGGSTTAHKNVMAANLLMWEAIRLGKRLGGHYFDMWGSLPPNYDKNDPWAGFTHFKQGYGTEFVEMIGSYDLVVNPFMYNVYNLLHNLRNLWFKLKK